MRLVVSFVNERSTHDGLRFWNTSCIFSFLVGVFDVVVIVVVVVVVVVAVFVVVIINTIILGIFKKINVRL